MKILFDHPNPFLLAHGGFQILIEQTKLTLEKLGMEVEFLRWWDAEQTGDIIYFFGRPANNYIHFAHAKGIKVVMKELLTGTGSRSSTHLQAQKFLIHSIQNFAPKSFTGRFAWNSYQLADAVVAVTDWEATLMKKLFAAPANHIHVIPEGVEDIFFRNTYSPRKTEWLVCSATITHRKRQLELARAAVIAKVPVWFIGAPYADTDPYYQSFLAWHKKFPALVKYEGAVNDRATLAKIYQSAHGFVLLSTMESLSLSALEAAAAGCPLLLSDLPWARSTFKEHACYCPITSPSATARHLQNFYEQPAPAIPPAPLTWEQVGQQLLGLYRSLSV
jgi:glycosyltransferase involved in cell wall biosynthesis